MNLSKFKAIRVMPNKWKIFMLGDNGYYEMYRPLLHTTFVSEYGAEKAIEGISNDNDCL